MELFNPSNASCSLHSLLQRSLLRRLQRWVQRLQSTFAAPVSRCPWKGFAMEHISCPMDDSGLPFPFNTVCTGSDGQSEPPSGALLSSRASVPLVAKPCPGCPSASATLDASGSLLPSGLGIVLCPPGCSWPEREIWGRTHSTCMIYSQFGTNHFKLRNDLIKEGLRATLGAVGMVGLASTC